MVKSSIYQEDALILNLYVPNTISLEYISSDKSINRGC